MPLSGGYLLSGRSRTSEVGVRANKSNRSTRDCRACQKSFYEPGNRSERRAGVYETGWIILHKLRRAMMAPARDKLSGIVEVGQYLLAQRLRRSGVPDGATVTALF